jgi:hypothetical protein
MNTEHLDIEAYAKTGDTDAVVSLLSRSIGHLRVGGAPEEEPLIYQSGSVSVVLQPSEDGFLSVWIRGCEAWPSCPALGRHLAKELGLVVRCDPGNEFPEVSPYSNVFLEIEGSDERLVPWG